MYYFAYGSNMSHSQMKKRCPDASFLKCVYLRDHKFVYDGFSERWNGAVANIIKSVGSRVWGGLYDINSDCLASLDRCEGYSETYDKKEIEVQDESDNSFTAWVYYRIEREIGKPSEEYYNIIIQGAYDCNLPKDYIQSLENSKN